MGSDEPGRRDDTIPTPMLHGTDSVDFDRETNTYRATFDYKIDPPSAVIVYAVAAISEREVVELDPFYGTLDPDALNGLFASLVESDHGGEARLQFAFDDYDITLYDTEVVEFVHRGIADNT